MAEACESQVSPELRAALARARAVRFLCTGNMVRSAFAELYARHLGCPLPVDSAATVFENEGLFPQTRAALAALGVEPRALDAFRPRRLDRVAADAAPGRVVFGMTPEHLDAYAARFGTLDLGTGPDRYLLTALLGREERVADPVLEGASFAVAFRTVQECVERLVEVLLEERR